MDDPEVIVEEHEFNGREDEADKDTPTESLAVIGKRVWEANQNSKKALDASQHVWGKMDLLEARINKVLALAVAKEASRWVQSASLLALALWFVARPVLAWALSYAGW